MDGLLEVLAGVVLFVFPQEDGIAGHSFIKVVRLFGPRLFIMSPGQIVLCQLHARVKGNGLLEPGDG